MPVQPRVTFLTALMVAGLSAAASAQWLDYPTPGVPRTTDGKPNLQAPAPRRADGKPDLSGMWGWETRDNCGAQGNPASVSIAIAKNDSVLLPCHWNRRYQLLEVHLHGGNAVASGTQTAVRM